MWQRAKLWLAVCVAAVGCAALTGDLNSRLIARGRIAAVDIEPIAPELVFMWEHTDSVEWLGCVQGELRDDTLHLVAVELASMDTVGPTRVVGMCHSTDTSVGSIHPHKQGSLEWRCRPSDVDYASYISQGEALMFVQCDRNLLWVGGDRVKIGPDTSAAHPR